MIKSKRPNGCRRCGRSPYIQSVTCSALAEMPGEKDAPMQAPMAAAKHNTRGLCEASANQAQTKSVGTTSEAATDTIINKFSGISTTSRCRMIAVVATQMTVV